MKKSKLFFSMLLIIIFCSFLQAQEVPVSDDGYEDVINETVFPFLEALKNGDVSLIKQYIAGDMYESRRILLEQNKEYPEFLRKYYQTNSSFQFDFNYFAEKIIGHLNIVIERRNLPYGPIRSASFIENISKEI